jgi:DNA repair exonuclease SbcCD ATPase subunit
MSSIESLRRRLEKSLGTYRQAGQKLEEERVALKRLERREDGLLEAQVLAQQVAQQVQTQVHAKVAEIVTRALEIFDEPYEFRIEFERKRGRTEARLVFLKEGLEVDPLTASGGGVVDVAAFALRVACLLLSRPPRRRLLVLDEPLKMLSAEYRDRARALLESLSSDLGVQFVVVTHDPRLRAGSVLTTDS